MNTMKRALALLLAAVSALSLTACGGNGDTAGTGAAADTPSGTPAPEYIYKAESTHIYSGASDAGVSPLVTADNGVYCATMEKVGENVPEGVTPEYEGQYDINEARLCFMDFSGKLSKLENYVPLTTDIDGEGKRDFVTSSHPENAAIDNDGNLVVLEQVMTSYSEAPEDVKADDLEYFGYDNSSTQSFIRVLDQTGAELSCAQIDLPADSYINGMYVDADGSVVIGCDTEIYAFGTDGEKHYTIQPDGYVYGITRVRDGRIAASLYENTGESAIRIIDSKEKALGSKSYSISDYAYELVPGSGEYDLYFTAGSSFCGFSLDSGESTTLFNWIDSDVNGDSVYNLRVGTDGVVRALSIEYSSKGDEYTIDLIRLTKVPYDSVPQKTHLTLATVYSSYELRSAVIKFNRSSDKYHIDIRDYYELTGSNDYAAAQTKLNTELMAGTLPDIIDLSSDMPYEQLAAKGLLEDLYPYIDSDSELDRSDFFPNILSAYEVDGKLCAAVAGFGIMSVIGASTVVGDTPGWTYDDYYAALAGMPEGCQGFDAYFTKNTMLQVGLAIDMNSFMDWTSGRCNFDSDAFKALLAFSDQFPSDADMENYELTEETSSAYRIAQGQQMLTVASIYSFNDGSNDNPFKTDVTYIGFPNATGEPGNVVSGVNMYGITSACQDKDAAWQFVRTFLTEEFQRDTGSLPTNINAFNTLLSDAQKIEYERDANGNILLDENGEKKRVVIGMMYDGANYSEIYSGITPERAETIKTLAQSTTKLLNYDQSIVEIVTSEAQAYFAGQKSVDEVARLVQSKANIYVNEQR